MRTRRFAALLVFAVVGCSRGPHRASPETVALNNRGVGLMGTYDFDAARAAFSSAAERAPDLLDIQVNLAIATLNRRGEGDDRTAQALLERVLARDVQHARANYCLGLVLLDNGKAADALSHLEIAARQRPGDAYAAYYVGQALTQTGNWTAALPWFERAMTRDPRLRSAMYGASLALQRAGRTAEADAMRRRFHDLETDPRSEVAEFKYTRMGPLAEAVTIDAPRSSPSATPRGPIFAAAAPIDIGGGVIWSRPERLRPSITVADIDGDGRPDLFIAGAIADGDRTRNIILRNRGDGFVPDSTSPLAGVTDVTAALWGDIDNDGLIDVYLCRRGGGQLWRQAPAGHWTDVTAAWRLAPPADEIDGAMIDADHDGDLDLLVAAAAGGDTLLNNNGDHTFRSLGGETGLSQDRRPSAGLLVADLDNDRDTDLLIIKTSPPHEVLLNDRGWRYHRDPAFAALERSRIYGAVAGDVDADGRVEIYASDDEGISRWAAGATGAWEPTRIAGAEALARSPQLALADVDGNGRLDLVGSTHGGGWEALSLDDARASVIFSAPDAGLATWTIASLDASRGVALVGMTATGAGPKIWRPGPGRWPFVTVSFSGRDPKSDQLRSNVSGIGVHAAARADSRWTVTSTLRSMSGPGQSLQPVAFGTGGSSQLDFISLTWSDGILQTELALTPGPLHVINERQRQLSSCPVLFAFDGRRFAFVTDLLGVGGIGTASRPGVYDPPRPRERLLLPDGALAARSARFELRIDEPMEEAAYIDAISLAAYDLPPGWQIALDERKEIAGPAATGEPRFFQRELLPLRAIDDEGRDQTAAIAALDGRAADTGRVDPRFIGRTDPHSLTLEFGAPLDASPGTPILIADGWIEYPYAQTLFAAWQAHASYEAPSIDARDARGQWHELLHEFGFPAGMPRRMSVPLRNLPRGTQAMRIRTSQEIYWDRLAVAYVQPVDVHVHALPLAAARVAVAGFAERHTSSGRRPWYDYSHRPPLWATRHQRGFYTAEGTVTELVAVEDGGVAIIGPGEELQLEFAGGLEPPPPGWTRRFVLDARGWCKDMDLYTRDGDTIEPIPTSPAATRAGAALNRRYNTRYESGR